MDKTRTGILFVLEHFHPYIGGVETLFLQLTRALAMEGYAVTVITTRHDHTLPLSEELHGIRIRRIRSRNRYLFTLMALPVAIRYARSCSFIHTSTYNAALPAFLAGLLARRKVIITVHEIWGKLWFRFPWLGGVSAWFHQLFEKAVTALPYHRYIAVSSYTAEALAFRGVPRDKTITIHNGVDYERLEGYRMPPQQTAGATGLHFIYFGRLGHSKGLDLIMAGGELFFDEYPDAVIELIIPQTPRGFSRKLNRMIAQSRHPGRFVISGSLPADALFKRLQQATALLIPSYSEGFCFAAAEAAALDIPVVTTMAGALMETVGGRVVVMEQTDAVSLCRAMMKAAQGAYELRAVLKYPLEQQVGAYLDLYNRL